MEPIVDPLQLTFCNFDLQSCICDQHASVYNLLVGYAGLHYSYNHQTHFPRIGDQKDRR